MRLTRSFSITRPWPCTSQSHRRATRGRSKVGSFGDWIHELDASVGRVLEVLDRRGLSANTIVLFTSDNGGVCEPTQKRPETVALEAGFPPNGRWRGGKVSCYEGGYRVSLHRALAGACSGGNPRG